MRRHLANLWLLLALAPFLCCSLLGEIPHQHGHPALAAANPMVASAHSATPSLSSADAGDDHCQLCEWNSAITACSSLAMPACPMPRHSSGQSVTPANVIARYLHIFDASRAPPFSLS